ncbi:tRNA (adenosine(37)-N6)-dimethylallyltransferase MiaA [Rarobacter faecitabidus]|uniref:tRNA dimethylallyltransferase n=1 Tax=Rarobacter faecitabidus TaxID=13243 RepID=A0A542ZWE2_RARFA|nr:tRNA (adenosine(37)-N6)-dimethylallyltransferase MiaA [Rarobacter faecitabidus]TQL64642.1 tRNA dimethylallyltransferase [Rarobacter faecitabidus]
MTAGSSASQRVLIAVVGPTAAGKSELALDLADVLGGPGHVEIVGADAFQLYRGMDIGTAKLPVSQRRGYQHHQIDVLALGEESSVADFQATARADVAGVERRGRRAIVVGGSGLYVRALLDDIDFPGTDPRVRARLEDRVRDEGSAALFDELASLDPVAARAMDPANPRRIVRALEVIELTGEPFSARLPRPSYTRPAVQLGVDYGREGLDERIERRVDAMLADGLLDEVATLAGGDAQAFSRTAARAVGYRESLAHLRGEIDLATARTQIIAATRRLARKQMGWFGRDPRIKWLRADTQSGAELVDRAAEFVREAQADPAATLNPAERFALPVSEPVRRRLGS